jgi:hypothetical protein
MEQILPGQVSFTTQIECGHFFSQKSPKACPEGNSHEYIEFNRKRLAVTLYYDKPCNIGATGWVLNFLRLFVGELDGERPIRPPPVRRPT